MPLYECEVTITIEADNEDEAAEKLCDALEPLDGWSYSSQKTFLREVK